jgi:phage gp37-like protein
MAYAIADIEDAILTVLQASALADVARTIDSYHGEIDDLVREVRSLTVPLPAVFVLYAGSVFDEAANRSFDDEQAFTVVAVARSLRSRAELRDGMYDLLEAIKAALIDNNLGLDIEPLHPVRIEAALVAKDLSVYGLDFKTVISLD